MKKDDIELICSIGELAGLFKEQTNIEGFLQQVVHMIAEHMNADLCSIYLLQHETEDLVLMASVGIPSSFIGKLILKDYEGITGRALSELKPMRIPKASQCSLYKYVPGTEEEKYEAFLAVPIIHGLDKVGVISLQHREENFFTKGDERAVSAIASQLAATLENARLLLEIRDISPTPGEDSGTYPNFQKHDLPTFLRGTPVSSGVAMGAPVYIGDIHSEMFLAYKAKEPEKTITEENFLSAMERTAVELEKLQITMEEQLSEVGSLIFSSHLLMLKDEAFSGMMIEKIRTGIHPGLAIVEVVNRYITLFSQSGNVFVQEKIHDVKDLGHRLLRNLEDEENEEGDYSGQIILARDMLPSDIIKLKVQHAEGFLLYGVSTAAHIAILARSLNVPVVTTGYNDYFSLTKSKYLVIDAYQGTIYVDPAEEIIQKYADIKELETTETNIEVEEKEEPAKTFTLDGEEITVLANINLLSDIHAARKMNAQGIGLYRSEFPFIIRNTFPSEEEQFQVYLKVFDLIGKEKEVALRTLDIGGDKKLSHIIEQNESNPFLGLRAIRFSLRNKDQFSSQVRAMLRAGYGKHLQIMFPLISSLDEFIAAKDFVYECVTKLDYEGIIHNSNPYLGAMVELPSAVEILEELAEEADFLSIGTNDLVQYLLGIDRTNELVSDLYNLYHPAVIRTVERILRTSIKKGCDVSVCGDAAMDIPMLRFMIGAGLRKISVDPKKLRDVREAIRLINTVDARKIARQALHSGTIAEVKDILEHRM